MVAINSIALKKPAQTPIVVIGNRDFAQSVNLSFSSLRRLAESMRIPTAFASMQNNLGGNEQGRLIRRPSGQVRFLIPLQACENYFLLDVFPWLDIVDTADATGVAWHRWITPLSASAGRLCLSRVCLEGDPDDCQRFGDGFLLDLLPQVSIEGVRVLVRHQGDGA